MHPKKIEFPKLTTKMCFIDFLSGAVCESSDDEDGCDKYGPSGIALSNIWKTKKGKSTLSGLLKEVKYLSKTFQRYKDILQGLLKLPRVHHGEAGGYRCERRDWRGYQVFQKQRHN